MWYEYALVTHWLSLQAEPVPRPFKWWDILGSPDPAAVYGSAKHTAEEMKSVGAALSIYLFQSFSKR